MVAAMAYGMRTDAERRLWMVHLGALFFLLLLWSASYWPQIEAAMRTWWISPTYSHCFLIIPISLYLIWEKRDEIARLTPEFFPLALLAAIPCLMLWLLGTALAINEAQQFAAMGMLQILIAATLGLAIYRTLLFPLLFLFFLVPTGDYLIPPLQDFTTAFIDFWLDRLGIVHFTEGYVIELTTGRFQVAEACAGLRFLIATVVLCALFAHLMFRKWRKVALFLLAAAIIPVIANGFRASGIVLLGYYSNNRLAVGVDHIVYGWGFSVIILLALLAIGYRFRDETVQAPSCVTPLRRVRASSSYVATLGIFAVTALVVASGPALAWWDETRASGTLNEAAFAPPPSVGDWSVTPPSGRWQPFYAAPDARLAFGLTRNGSTESVDATVNYYLRDSLVESTNSLWGEAWRPVAFGSAIAELGETRVTFSELIVSSRGQRIMIWWTYWRGGQFTPSGMVIKLLGIPNLLGRERGAALLALSTPLEGTGDDARRRLRDAAAGLGDIAVRLASATK
jgi:exosortase A